MKKLINRLICLFRGHKWKWIEEWYLGQSKIRHFHECDRCGKIKEDVI